MKKVISALTVAAMCTSMAASTMSAFAVYKEGDVAAYLKIISADKGTISADGTSITFASAADAANAKLVVGEFLKCDPAQVSLQQMSGMYTTDTTAIKLGDDSGSGYSYAKKIGNKTEYTVNGKTFETNKFVNCFGYVDAIGDYVVGANGTLTNWQHSSGWGEGFVGNGDNDVLQIGWATDFLDKENHPDDYTQTAHFLDTVSDSLPFSQFDVTIGDKITDGSHEVTFLKEYTHPEYGVKVGNWFNPDGKTQCKITDLTGIKIIVGDASTPTPTDPTPTDPKPTDPKPTDPPQQPTTGAPNTGDDDNKGQDVSNLTEWTWYVQDSTYDPEKDQFAKVNVIMGAKDPGTFAYEFGILIDGKPIKESDLVLSTAKSGDAYEDLPEILVNLEDGHVGVAQGDKNHAEDSFAEDGSVIVTYYFKVPDTAKSSYKITLNEVNVSNFDAVKKSPKTIGGTLTIKGKGTTDPTQPAPTDPTPTDPQPTQPTPTDPSVQPGNYLYGDVNEDGKVELVDVVKLNRYLVKLDKELSATATVNANCYRSGETDANTTATNLDGKDSMEILKYLIGLVTALPTQG